MIIQIKILLLLANLLLGLAVLGYIYGKMKRYQSLYLNLVFKYTAFTIALLLLVFLFKYIEINILQRNFNLNSYELLPYSFCVIYFAGFTLVITMYRVILSFQNKILTKKKLFLIYSVAIVVVLLILSLTIIAARKKELHWLISVFDSLGIIFFLLEFGLLVHLYLYSRGLGESKLLIQRFSIFYLIRYPLLIIAFLFPDPVRMFIVVFFLNLIPYIWINKYVDKFESRKVAELDLVVILQIISKEFNISSRELDILKLILDGKNNKQIEEELFISYHTVKNHVYNLFQKLEVHNRYELISFCNKRKAIIEKKELF